MAIRIARIEDIPVSGGGPGGDQDVIRVHSPALCAPASGGGYRRRPWLG